MSRFARHFDPQGRILDSNFSPFFEIAASQAVYQSREIQHRFGKQLLDLRALVRHVPLLLGVRHFQNAELRLSMVKGCGVQPVAAA
jgi:hypothetical protein